MKVLLVSHNYPPTHVAGTEQYTAQLARGLLARGYEVLVFTSDKDIGKKHLSLSKREFEGVVVHELVNNLSYESFRETWDFPVVEGIFDGFLEREKPDLVHFNHLLYLSVGCAEAADRRNIPVVFTLHDYWLQCARFGQRVHADKSICMTIEEQRCSECLGNFRYKNSQLEQRVAGWIAKIHSASGVDLTKPARVAGDWLRRREGEDEGAGAPALPLEDVAARNRELRERLNRSVNRFLSPSAFLRDQLVEWGLDKNRLQHLRTGTDLDLFAGGQREPRGDKLRIAFIGSLIPVKGAHLAMQAWGELPEELRARARFDVYGPKFHDAEYNATLESLAEEFGVQLAGKLDREGVADTLRKTDLLVMPSLWFENQPLIILEALAAKTALCVSNLGGMAELVEEGKSGFGFPVGDAGALAKIMQSVIEEPAQLDALYTEQVAIPTVANQLDEIESVYRELAPGLKTS
ncbi:MAG: glycosyltransferase involved in cell wall biosynthesis [Planctomycetota bacterium]|jgi:glycosyltransferase involved in cell wall biosynthesis